MALKPDQQAEIVKSLDAEVPVAQIARDMDTSRQIVMRLRTSMGGRCRAFSEPRKGIKKRQPFPAAIRKQ